jgi:hypothetical protein
MSLILPIAADQAGAITLNDHRCRKMPSHGLVGHVVPVLRRLQAEEVRVVVLLTTLGSKIWSASHDINEPPGTRSALLARDPITRCAGSAALRRVGRCRARSISTCPPAAGLTCSRTGVVRHAMDARSVPIAGLEAMPALSSELRRARGGAIALAVLLVLAFLADSASADPGARLELCRAAPDKASRAADPERTAERLRVAAGGKRDPSCQAVDIQVPAAAIEASWLVSAELAADLSAGVVLVESAAGKPGRGYWERVTETTVPGGQSAPLFTDLLPSMKAMVFGREERASIERHAGDLRLACGAGNASAGAVLASTRWHVPRSDGTLSLVMDGEGGGIAIGIADDARRRGEAPLMLGSLEQGGGTVSLPVPAGLLAPAEPLSVTLLCPPGKSAVRLTGLQFERTTASRPVDHAAWVWHAEQWLHQGDDLVARLTAEGITRAYVSVPVADDRVAHARALERFIAAARQHGIAVWVVEGDPSVILAVNRPQFIARTAALAVYNRAVGPDARLAGVQYDIEPYLLRGFALDPAAWLDALADLLANLSGAARMPVDVVIPFWLPDQPGGERFMRRLAEIAGSLTVMAYRTDPLAIHAAAAPVLEWGDLSGRTVHVALESGNLPEEQRRIFRPASQGRLWAVPVGGRTALLLLDRARANANGSALEEGALRLVDQGWTSFLGDEVRLRRLLPNLIRSWLAHPSFAGIALHGLVAFSQPMKSGKEKILQFEGDHHAGPDR